ncbi:MAG: V-type ATP synthase subunit I [Eubacteriales bacterium]
MAIVKMKHLHLLGIQEEREDLLQKLQRLGTVEVSNVDKTDLPSLSQPDSAALDEYKSCYQAGEQALEILQGYSKPNGPMFKPRPVISEKDLFAESERIKGWETITQITEAKGEISTLEGEKTALLQKKDSLLPWEKIDLPLETESTSGISVQFGVLPSGTDVKALGGKLSVTTDLAELTEASEGKDGVYALLTCYTPQFAEALELLKVSGWSRVNFRGAEGTAKENIKGIEERLSDIEKRSVQKAESLTRMGEFRPNIQKYLDGTQQLIVKEEAKTRLLDTDSTFYLDGWVVADKLGELESMLSGFTVAFETADPTEDEIPVVPVKLQNGKLSRSLSIVTEMYSLPAYNGVDPNPLMAPFFIFFYGMMMADMGYGLLMIFATQYVLSKAKPKGGMRDFCELFRMAGYSTFVWGVLTAGFFGNFVENFLLILNPSSTFTWFWPAVIDPMSQSIEILIAAMGFGAVHLLTGMVISFVKKTKDGKLKDAIMDEGSWWLLFIGGALGVLGSGWYVCYAGVAALVLTQGRANKGIGKIVGGVASLYDITGYFGDILSYARLMALMLAGSVIASVFNDLGMIVADGMGGGAVGLIPYIIIAFLGNALNFLLNLLGCFVHTLRLQCLEFFGKFYMDGGRAFQPLNMDTKYVDISGQN